MNLKIEQQKLTNLKIDWGKKKEQSLKDLWDYNKRPNIFDVRIS